MFEKEAKKWVKENTLIEHSASFGDIHTEPSAEKGFQQGAEFGYNKANEWHYVKDELPPSNKDKYYFVVDKLNEPMIARFYEGKWSNYSVIEDVIVWKEIVLPKESE